MRYRRFRTDGGQFLDALLTVDGDAFSVSADSHRTDHEAGYGISPLTVVDGDTDPWDGVSVLVPRSTPRPQSDEPNPDIEIARSIEAATTLDELKNALLGRSGLAAARGRLRGG